MNRLILLVEDDENDVFFFTRALKKLAIENPLRVANDGREALDYIEGRGRYANREEFPMPHLIMLDLKLPHVKGLDVLKRVREVCEPSLIVVILSSSKNESDITQAYRLGANAYLTKPANFEGLVDLVRGVHGFWIQLNVTKRSDVASVSDPQDDLRAAS